MQTPGPHRLLFASHAYRTSVRRRTAADRRASAAPHAFEQARLFLPCTYVPPLRTVHTEYTLPEMDLVWVFGEEYINIGIWVSSCACGMNILMNIKNKSASRSPQW